MRAGLDPRGARQDADPDIGPIMRWKRARNDRPRWEDISPESREAKVLWRQWERLYLVGGVLHRRFHELEGQGWRPQLVVPMDRRGSLLQRFHGGMIGAHLGAGGTGFLLAMDVTGPYPVTSTGNQYCDTRRSDATATRAAEKGVGKDVDRERE